MRFWATLPAILPGLPVYGPKPITGSTAGAILPHPSMAISRPDYDIQPSSKMGEVAILGVARQATARFVGALSWVPRDQWVNAVGAALGDLREGAAVRIRDGVRRLLRRGVTPINALREAVARELAATVLTRITRAGQTAADPWRIPTDEGLVTVVPSGLHGVFDDLVDAVPKHVAQAAHRALREIEVSDTVQVHAPSVTRAAGVAMSVPAGAATRIGQVGTARLAKRADTGPSALSGALDSESAQAAYAEHSRQVCAAEAARQERLRLNARSRRGRDNVRSATSGLGGVPQDVEVHIDQVLQVARQRAVAFLDWIAEAGVASEHWLDEAVRAFGALRTGAEERIRARYAAALAAGDPPYDTLVDAIAREAAATAFTVMTHVGQQIQAGPAGLTGFIDDIWGGIQAGACSAVDFASDTVTGIICSDVGGAAAATISGVVAGTAGSVVPVLGTAGGAAAGGAAGAVGQQAVCAVTGVIPGCSSGSGPTRTPTACPPGSGRLESTSILGGNGNAQKRDFLQRTGNAFVSDGVSGRSCWKFARPVLDFGCSGRSSAGPGACHRGLRCPPGFVIERTNIFHASPKERLRIVQDYSVKGTDGGYQKPYFCAQLSRPVLGASATQAMQARAVQPTTTSTRRLTTQPISTNPRPISTNPRLNTTPRASWGWLALGSAVAAVSAYTLVRRKT